MPPRLSSAIDFARWSSAFLVLMYHVRVNVMARPSDNTELYSETAEKIFLHITGVGHPAVISFFVISGFLVGGSVAKQVRDEIFSFKKYAIKRSVRLYLVLIPALILGLTLDLIRLHYFGFSAAPSPGMESPDNYSILTIIGNVFYLQNIFVPTLGSNIPLWSLSAEAWYYITFPLICALLMTQQKYLIRVALFFSGIAIISAGIFANYLVVVLFSAWLIGMAARLCPFRLIKSSRLGWLIVLIAVFGYPIYSPHLTASFIIPALALSNVLLTLRFDNEATQPKSLEINRYLAGFSFSLYLTHAPIIHFALAFAFWTANPYLAMDLSPASFAICAAIVVLCITAAWLFSRITEEHNHQVTKYISALFVKK